MSTLKRGEEEYYNKQTKPLTPLRIGQKVRIQDPTTKKWDRCGDTIGIENTETITFVYQVDKCTDETDASSDQP